MNKLELIKKLEQVKRNIYERRMMDSTRTLTLIINDLKLEIEEEEKKI